MKNVAIRIGIIIDKNTSKLSIPALGYKLLSFLGFVNDINTN